MNVRPSQFLWRSISLAAVISVCLAASARAQAPLTYTWINPATGGVWSDPSQWADINADGSGDVADGANNTANFGTLDITATNTINMDNDHTLGNLIFGDTTPSNNWIVNAGTSPVTGLPSVLTLSTTLPGTVPTVTVNNQTATLNTVIAGTQGFNKNGNGSLVLSTAISTITGNINVNAGTLSVISGTVAIPAGVQINLNGGTTLNFGDNGKNPTMANQVTVVNSVGSNGTPATLSGAGFTNATTGGTANIISIVINGNGSLNWNFGTLNIINANMFQNFGGTVTFSNSAGTVRVSAGNTTQNMPFATVNLGTSSGVLNTKAGQNTTFIMGELAGGNNTNLGSGTTGTANTLIVGSANASQSFSGRLFQNATSTNAPNVIKVGTGAWTINPNAVFTPNALNLNANGGTLVADYSNLATATNLFTATSTLNFGGGTFNLLAKSTGATAQTFGNVNANNGSGRLVVNTNGGTGTTLTLGTIASTGVSGSLNISATGTGTFAATSTTAPDATGVYGGGKVTMTNAAGATDWAASTTAAAPFTLSNYAAYTTLPTATTTDTTNDLATGNVTLAGAITTNSLKVANTATSQALNLGGKLLTLTNGGLLATGANAYAINNGTITSGLATTPAEQRHAARLRRGAADRRRHGGR